MGFTHLRLGGLVLVSVVRPDLGCLRPVEKGFIHPNRMPIALSIEKFNFGLPITEPNKSNWPTHDCTNGRLVFFRQVGD